jgi:histone acetyltransferase (RNA polymerase elongator complex component)
MKHRYWIFPVFLPNLGCPYRCTFCDQHAVTGKSGAYPAVAELDGLFNKVRFSKKTGKNSDLLRQIAFYGGNFSGLSRMRQTEYLNWAADKVARGEADSIRFSTRPDALDKDEILFLKDYPIRTIEIGVQSMNNAVLSTVRRGHNAEDSEKAIAAIIANGWEAGVQLMPGLPGETLKGFLQGVETVSEWGIHYARLYPAVVLKGTRLAEEYSAGRYRPLPCEEAVEWCVRASEIFEKRNIQVIRVGLPASDILKASVVAGPYHAAFGFLVQSFRFHKKLRAAIYALPGNPHAVHIHLSRPDLPLLMGDKCREWEDLKARFSDKKLAYFLETAFSKGIIRVKADSAS